jgi:hypothetical protein
MSSSNIYGSYVGRPQDDYYRDRDFYDRGTPPAGAGGAGDFNRQEFYRGQGAEGMTRFPTHYGQVCCYDEKGFLMQTTYQPVIKVIEEVHKNKKRQQQHSY